MGTPGQPSSGEEGHPAVEQYHQIVYPCSKQDDWIWMIVGIKHVEHGTPWMGTE
jgi:hypothetical protein